MIIKIYREATPGGGWKGVIEEIRKLISSPDIEARAAGVDFARTLKSMVSKQQMFAATPLPVGTWRSYIGPIDSLWCRRAKEHHLYLSHVKVPPMMGGPELRALLAAYCLEQDPTILQEVVKRHLSLNNTPASRPGVSASPSFTAP